MPVDPSAETEAERPGATAAPAPLASGGTLGKYRLERLLGTGGMGVVWAATDPDLERAVAIKVLRSIDGSETQRTRLLREARAMARLKHPNVLTVYEVGTSAGIDYIAMELVDGDNLATWLERAQDRAEVITALLAAGRGLAAAHAAGIVHRDFKPENVLRDRSGHIFVTDFGLAFGQVDEAADLVPLSIANAQADRSAPGAPVPAVATGSHRRALDSILDSPLTQTGVLIGTPAYMAPEQFVGRAAGPRSDQFAFCVTVWEALTGDRPFRGKDLAELRAAGAGGAPPRGTLAPAVHAVLSRGLAPDPDQRWPDMPALLAALERALASTAPRGSKLPLLVGLAAVVLVGGGVAIYLLSHRGGAAIASGCEAPDRAFAAAWSPAQRAVIAKAHPGMAAIAPLAILDETRTQWIRMYTETCAKADTPERHEQLACLLGVRDEVASTVKELEADADGELDITDVVGLATTVQTCGTH